MFELAPSGPAGTRRAFVDLGSDGAVDTVTANGTGQRDLVTVPP